MSGLSPKPATLFVEATDLAVPGRGGARALDFALVRRYESQPVYSGPIGWGWDFNYHRCLQELPNGDINYFNGLGRRDQFKAKRTGPAISGYESPEGVFAELKRRADGVWTMVFPNLYTEIFDQYGRLARIQDRNDNALELYYDAGGRLTAVMDTMARLYTFEYYLDDGTPQSGRLKSVSDYSGRKVEYAYDLRGDLVTVRYGERVREYFYSVNDTDIKLAHNLIAVTDPKGQHAVEITYSGDSVVAEMINGMNASVSAGELAAATTDGLGHTRSYALDGKGHVTAVTEAGATTQYAYNADGLVTSVTYPLGNKQELTYDSQNTDRRAQANLLQVKAIPDARGGDLLVTTYTYQPWTNQAASVVDPKGNSTRLTLDTQGNVTAIAAPDNTTTQITRDKYGRVVQQTDPLGKTTVSEYYPETSPGGATQQTPPSRPLDTSGGGYLAKLVSDPAGDNLASEFAYDVRGNVLSHKDGEGVVTSYTVDAYNAVTSFTAGGADGTVSSSFSYDANGNV
ncbi:MAG: RHS repeat protein, partial [Acidobacteria bacterium]|nr:RHS repeat protein [Acidobacteriota bacterium]